MHRLSKGRPPHGGRGKKKKTKRKDGKNSSSLLHGKTDECVRGKEKEGGKRRRREVKKARKMERTRRS